MPAYSYEDIPCNPNTSYEGWHWLPTATAVSSTRYAKTCGLNPHCVPCSTVHFKAACASCGKKKSLKLLGQNAVWSDQELKSGAKERPTPLRKPEQRCSTVCRGFLSPYQAETHTVT